MGTGSEICPAGDGGGIAHYWTQGKEDLEDVPGPFHDLKQPHNQRINASCLSPTGPRGHISLWSLELLCSLEWGESQNGPVAKFHVYWCIQQKLDTDLPRIISGVGVLRCRTEESRFGWCDHLVFLKLSETFGQSFASVMYSQSPPSYRLYVTVNQGCLVNRSFAFQHGKYDV